MIAGLLAVLARFLKASPPAQSGIGPRIVAWFVLADGWLRVGWLAGDWPAFVLLEAVAAGLLTSSALQSAAPTNKLQSKTRIPIVHIAGWDLQMSPRANETWIAPGN